MRQGGHVITLAAARFYAPLLVLTALVILATRDAGAGVGLISGFVLATAFAAYLLVFGASAARRALPPAAARLLCGVGVLACAAAAGAPRLPGAAQWLEAGLFLTTAAGVSLVLLLLAGRAPTLREDDA